MGRTRAPKKLQVEVRGGTHINHMPPRVVKKVPIKAPALAKPVMEAMTKEMERDYLDEKLHYENKDVEDIYRKWDEMVPPEDYDCLSKMVQAFIAMPPDELRTSSQLTKAFLRMRKKWRCSPRKAHLNHVYNIMVADGVIPASERLQRLLVTKPSRSQSGVLVITVLTSPYPKVLRLSTGCC